MPLAAEEMDVRSSSDPVTQLHDMLPAEQPRDGRTTKIRLFGSLPPDAVQVDAQNGLVSIFVRDAPLNDVLGILAQNQGLNVIAGEDITACVSVTLDKVPFERALTHILAVAGYTWVRQGNILIITRIAAGNKLSPYVQGKEIRVFRLDYVAATDVDVVIKGFLSPAGQSFATESDETDNRKTQEIVVVEDLAAYLDPIEEYIRQVDVPPRQVLIEVHVLSIELEDDLEHGINLEYLDELGVPSATLRTQGFADAAAFAKGTSPAFFFDLAAGDLNALVQALETTTDAKTLAKPKVLALNGQEARIQVGERLGYRITTTTQTSSLEGVEFLDLGVVLTVTPRITKDNNVIMYVKPEVSSGDVVDDLPEEETTEVETALMLPDGRGMLIGGLIQESDVEIESKIPVLGDIWLIGRLFQKHEIERRRTEIIIALIPHVVPYQPIIQERECEQFRRTTTPLLYGPLLQNPRPSEPRFPNAGQRLPFPYKTQHLRTIPDSAAWAPQGSRQQCVYGAPPIPPTYYDTPPFGEGIREYGEMLDNSETIPTPLPQQRW